MKAYTHTFVIRFMYVPAWQVHICRYFIYIKSVRFSKELFYLSRLKQSLYCEPQFSSESVRESGVSKQPKSPARECYTSLNAFEYIKLICVNSDPFDARTICLLWKIRIRCYDRDNDNNDKYGGPTCVRLNELNDIIIRISIARILELHVRCIQISHNMVLQDVNGMPKISCIKHLLTTYEIC